MAPSLPLVLFGACDRHNLGDLLFPHVIAALFPTPPLAVAGLVARDLRRYGGHLVEPLSQLTTRIHEPYVLIHVGGEILTCSVEEAALMLVTPAEPATALEPRLPGPAPYVIDHERAGRQARIVHFGVGGCELDAAPAALRRAVLAALGEAEWLAVRDRHTAHVLRRHGLDCALVPDAAVLTRELFGPRIASRAARGELAAVRQSFPEGWLAVQFSLDFADEASLAALAAACDHLAGRSGLPLVLFRAGAAPLHDDLGLYSAVLKRLAPGTRTRLFHSLDIWDICALIAESRGFLGSSLHGRLLALIYGLPRASLGLTPRRPRKLRAFVESWEVPGMPGVLPPQEAAVALASALDQPQAASLAQATRLAARCRAALEDWISRLLARV
ncbi:polysaccharide pyruvyl transferase family protein [Thiobacter aerophilum]|uniref:Polysaccharide pyruvyl transferase family protein n=1 Tax=Thiobacter aerophilum TaxID=3121275 RepID=A0ABV0EH01_9BURK